MIEDSSLDKKALDEARAFSAAAAQLAVERHCSDVIIIDLKGHSPLTDFFVVATGTSGRQMRTVCDEISAKGREMDFKRFGRAGYDQARWILLDFVSVIVHIFDDESREFYNLETLWADVEVTPMAEQDEQGAA